ncbi:vascular endothelial zinc finger 1 [Crotalus adamanteus]|uniref:Vascular endothelial zinc finger 1 n=1 Tax=Crotalus adamanteus TaxID=8729 RepID=A0AAW1CD39_CROAD
MLQESVRYSLLFNKKLLGEIIWQFKAHEASHHQQQAAQNSLLPLLSSAVEPPDQKPILPLPITQKPQPPPETLKDAIVGIKKEKPKTSFVWDNSRTSLVSTIAGILSTVTTSSSATNPSSSAGATAMPGTQTVKKPSKPVKKNHACEMCGKAFRDVYHLNRHKLSHSDEKPFECPICNQRFKRKDRMTYHVRSHEGGITKPYTCGVCGKGFSRPDHLSCHVKHVHSTERPFKCQTCTAAFATKDRLRTHMVRHEGKVSCNICGKLLSAAYITSHLKTHGQSQSINCNTCKQGINKKFGFFKQENLHLPASCMNEESNNQKQQQQQQSQQQHVTNWPGKQVETLRLWEEAVKARKKESQQTLRPTSVKQECQYNFEKAIEYVPFEAANLCQTSTAAPTPVTLSTPFNITSSVASGTITNPVTDELTEACPRAPSPARSSRPPLIPPPVPSSLNPCHLRPRQPFRGVGWDLELHFKPSAARLGEKKGGERRGGDPASPALPERLVPAAAFAFIPSLRSGSPFRHSREAFRTEDGAGGGGQLEQTNVGGYLAGAEADGSSSLAPRAPSSPSRWLPLPAGHLAERASPAPGCEDGVERAQPPPLLPLCAPSVSEPWLRRSRRARPLGRLLCTAEPTRRLRSGLSEPAIPWPGSAGAAAGLSAPRALEGPGGGGLGPLPPARCGVRGKAKLQEEAGVGERT